VTNPAPLVCLLTPGHVASTPRLIKNADALVEAGYRVHVIAGRHFAPAEPLDAEILSAAKWSYTLINSRSGPGVTARKLLRRVARRLIGISPLATPLMAAYAHQPEIPRLAVAAARVGASFYFGHCLGGLPAAARAAHSCSVPYGFDAEDFHDAETTEAVRDRVERTMRRTLQVHYLSGCALMTAASPLIASQYAKIYGTRTATTILNVFPLSHAPAAPVEPGPISEQRPARLYWFSQTIGPGRGLEAMVAILARMRTPVLLQLRGFVSESYKASLTAVAKRATLARPIEFLSPGAPSEMARLAAGAHLGLSIEESAPLNRDLCLTNKIFAYLLAGIPQLLTPTSAQRALAPELGQAARLIDPYSSEQCAAQLDDFISNSAALVAARNSAWQLGQTRFNWEHEQRKLLAAMRTLFDSSE